jgi:hypothetical protein
MNAQCEVCGITYDKAMEIRVEETVHTFDCFECAIHVLAPACVHCGCRIIGHGVESQGEIFCGARCAKQGGVVGVRDRIEMEFG